MIEKAVLDNNKNDFLTLSIIYAIISM